VMAEKDRSIGSEWRERDGDRKGRIEDIGKKRYD